MSKRQRRILEAMDPIVGPVLEPTVGVDAPKDIYQCDVCSSFITTTESKPELPSSCPVCGATPLKVTQYGTVDTQLEPTKNATVQREPTAALGDANKILDEAIQVLESGDVNRFASTYKNITALNKKGELVTVVESSVARRRLSAKQRSTHRLSEKITNESKINSSRLKAVRLNAFLVNEARNIKRKAKLTSIYEGVETNPESLDDGMEDILKESDYTNYIEDLLNDEKVAEALAGGDNEDAVAEFVEDIIEDAGLKVISSEVIDQDEDATVIAVRVVDNDEVDFHTSELEEALHELVDGDITINGVEVPGATGDVMDLEIIINNSDSIIESDDEFKGDEDIFENEEEDEILESTRSTKSRRSPRGKRSARKVLESKSDDISGTIEINPDDQLTHEDIVEVGAELIDAGIDATHEGDSLVVEYEDKQELNDILDIIEDTVEDDLVAEYVTEFDIDDDDELNESDEEYEDNEEDDEESPTINEFLQRVRQTKSQRLRS